VTDLVSVVIPCRNERNAIGDCVRSILASDHPSIEVLVVDGMSDDGTRDLVREMQKDQRVRLIDNPNKLTPYAFNLGILNARGSYIQIVGSRNNLSSSYISTLKKVLDTRPDVACVGGDYQHIYENEATRFLSLAMESKFGVGGSNYRTQTQDCEVDTVGIPLYRREIFNELGLFDENFTRNQDDEFNFRVRQRGDKILYVHAARATYLVRSSFKKAFQQFYQYGYFKVLGNKKHKTLTTTRQIVPAAFVTFWAIWFATFWLNEFWRDIGIAVALLYISLGLIAAGKSLSLIDRARVLRACFLMHLAYGIGFLQGILDFVILGRAPRADLQKQTV
jgi:glycosyltransferase involved in cell wall biosynthesis